MLPAPACLSPSFLFVLNAQRSTPITALSFPSLQARAAELLALHVELRSALFGRSAVHARCSLPDSIPLDVLRLLQLWDYEAGLSPQVGSQGARGGSRCCRCCMVVQILQMQMVQVLQGAWGTAGVACQLLWVNVQAHSACCSGAMAGLPYHLPSYMHHEAA